MNSLEAFATEPTSTEPTSTEWVELVVDTDYEINTEYPYEIRRKSNKRIISESVNHYGYIQIALNQKNYKKHRVIALQFILNPNNFSEVDHIDHDRTNYHIENLRWISSSNNSKNKASNKGVVYEFVDDIPDDSIKVTHYNSHEFEDYYYYHDDETNEDNFYWFNGKQYRILHINESKRGYLSVIMRDIENKRIQVCLSKFKKMYDLI